MCEPGKKPIKVVLGVLDYRVIGIARHRERSAHDVVQAGSLEISEQIPLSQHNGETKNAIERRNIQRLLRFEDLLSCQLMIEQRYALVAQWYHLDANWPASAPSSSFAKARAAMALLKVSGSKVELTSG
jgi:hypothetical protein